MLIEFAGVKAENEELLEELVQASRAVLAGGAYIGGVEVERFEQEFARLHGSRYAVGVNSGTDALRLVLRVLRLPPGAEVITVANTFVATVGAIVAERLQPVMIDVGEDENIDPELVRQAVTPHTRAVIAVHLRGLPARVDLLRTLCDEHDLVLIEDCAQAVGAELAGTTVGRFGTVGCFSLHPLKNLGACGDAGVVVTDDEDIAGQLRLLRNHGLADRDTVVAWGENSRLDALQAALLNVKLLRFGEWTARRIELAKQYHNGLVDLPLTLPVPSAGSRHVYHRYAIRSSCRTQLSAALAASGVQTAIHYPVPIHRQPAARSAVLRLPLAGLPRTERQAAETLSLPLYPQLATEDIGYVIQTVHTFFERSGAHLHD
jgi:dTDP-4-amino-4,6-dideoxygalactose transaminase